MPKSRSHSQIKTQHLAKLYFKRVKLLLIIVFFSILIILLYWFIFLSDFFQIKKIIINGIDKPEVIELDINNYLANKNHKFVPLFIYKIFPRYQNNQKNLLLFSASDYSQHLLNKYPEIEKLSSKLDIKNGYLTIDLTLREISFLLCTDNDCYLLDKTGVVFAEAPQTSGNLIRRIIIHQNNPFSLGTRVFAQADLDILNSLFEMSARDNSPFKINALEIEKTKFSTIKIVTTDNWYLLVNFDSDFAKIFQIIKKLLDGELKNKTTKLEYIDCRYLPRVYYLLK